jgi:proline dehydrogenase
MSLMRSVLLAGSESVWLRERATRSPFVRRSVSRFMPGERLEDALRGAEGLKAAGTGTIVTYLGENLTDADAAREVVREYLRVLARVQDLGLDTHISVKPTQLGLDQDGDLCFRSLMTLLEGAAAGGHFVWIDMESSTYVDRTLDLFRRARAISPLVGLCLQAYLRRTADDLESLLPLGSAIRLVKGAYREPPDRAFPRKQDVDESFYALAARFLAEGSRHPGSLLGIATHDPRLVERLRRFAAEPGAPRAAYEFEMLYGIQRPLQKSLVEDGVPLRVLISYGDHWFPWYMRRLAERPANVLFVARSLLAG